MWGWVWEEGWLTQSRTRDIRISLAKAGGFVAIFSTFFVERRASLMNLRGRGVRWES